MNYSIIFMINYSWFVGLVRWAITDITSLRCPAAHWRTAGWCCAGCGRGLPTKWYKKCIKTPCSCCIARCCYSFRMFSYHPDGAAASARLVSCCFPLTERRIVEGWNFVNVPCNAMLSNYCSGPCQHVVSALYQNHSYSKLSNPATWSKIKPWKHHAPLCRCRDEESVELL